MAKFANAGALRTTVKFVEIEHLKDSDGYTQDVESLKLTAKCKWVNIHGSEVWEAMQQQLNEPATLTLRYTPLINPRMIIYKGDDEKAYEIISVNNVEDTNKWLEIKVQRKTEAR